LGQAISISSVGGGGGAILPGGGDTSGTPTGAGATPGNVSGISVSGVLDPKAFEITLTVSFTAGSGTFSGVHCWLDIPDHGSATDATAKLTVGSSTVGTAKVAGPFEPIDLGLQTNPTQPWTFNCAFPQYTGLDPNQNIPCRLYISSISSMTDNVLIQDGLTNATPNCAFSLVSLASGTPTAATNVTVNCGTITCQVMPNDNTTGKLLTPVWATMGSVPSNPPAGWGYRLYISYGTMDATLPANLTAVTGTETVAGIIPPPSASDGIQVAHSFAIATPTATTNATIWALAGLTVGGTFKPNNVVPGVTNSCPISFGSTTGTVDASQQMLSTIDASMSVVSGLFGVAAAGITNPLMGSGAVGTINVAALAVTNPLLASLCTEAANLASGSVTAGNSALASLSVPTSAVQTSAITGTQIASAAVAHDKMATSSVTAANGALDTLSVPTAAIQSAAVTNTQIGSGAVGTSTLAATAVTAAKMASSSITSGNGALATSSVVTASMTSGSVTSTQMAAGSVTSGNAAIAAAAIGTAGIQTAAITNALIANLAVDYTKIANGTIGSAQIGTAAIAYGNIGSCSISSLVAGTCTFSGTATFQYGSGGPSVVINSSQVYLGNSSQFVTVNSSSISISNSTSSLALSSTGLSITAGTNTLTATSSYIELSNSTSGQKVHLTSSALVIQNGSSYGISINGSTGVATFTNAGTTTTISSGVYAITTGGISALSLACLGGNISTTATGTTSTMTYNTLTIGNYQVINSVGQFVGFGVSMTGYGVTASGFNPYISGTQYYGATGTFTYSTHVLTIKGGVITTIT
jgi:hypothetical protein